MTDLLHTIPDFPTNHYTHLLPSLEKHLITTTDLLTLDALDVAKRAQLPLLDVRRLKEHVVAILQSQLGLKHDSPSKFEGVGEDSAGFGSLKQSGEEVTRQWSFISTLDDSLDAALGGGIPTGYITEITGESGAGKTQLLLSLLLSAQLPPPHGLSRPSLYISTEHPLPTTRLSQLLRTNLLLSTSPFPQPSLSQILTLQTPDLESQDHILTYQLPVALSRHNIGLVVIDSIAANYRAHHTPSALATRSAQLVRLGALLRELARSHNCAIVAANQVADRFPPTPFSSRGPPSIPGGGGAAAWSSSPASTATNPTLAAAPSVLSLDHQQRFFTGWGDDCSGGGVRDLKTPSLGLVWANQIAARVALIKEVGYAGNEAEGAEWTTRRWRRWMRVVFAAWAAGSGEGERGVEFEVWEGGVRAVRDTGDVQTVG